MASDNDCLDSEIVNAQFNHMGDLLFLCDPFGVVLRVSVGLCKALNQRENNLVGQRIDGFFSENDAIRILTRLQKVRELKAPSEQYESFTFFHALHYFRTFYTPVKNSVGDIVAILWRAIDVSNQRQLEQCLSVLGEPWPESLSSSTDVIVSQMSRALQSELCLIGLMQNDTVQTVSVCHNNQIVSNMCYELDGTPCALTLNGQMVVFHDNVAAQFPKDAQLQNLNLRSYVGLALYDQQGQVTGLIAALSSRAIMDRGALATVFRLFAARAQLELTNQQQQRDLQRWQQQLEIKVLDRTAQMHEAMKELEIYTGVVASHLLSPLRIIDAMQHTAGQQLNAGQTEDVLPCLQQIEKNIHDMQNQLNGLNQIVRVNSLPFVWSKLDISEMANQIAQQHLLSATASMSVDIEPGIVAAGDRELISQLLLQLIENACKFSRSVNNPALRVLVSERTEDRVTIAVQDNGVGISEELQGGLFQPFAKAHAKTQFEGPGLGLALVKRIVLRHLGQTWLSSKLGEGSCTYFSLPLKSPADS